MADPRPISSKDNPLLVRVRKLGADPGAYRKLGEVWLEGDHLCDAFVRRGGRALQAIVSAEGWSQPALRELASHAAAVAIVPPERDPAPCRARRARRSRAGAGGD